MMTTRRRDLTSQGSQLLFDLPLDGSEPDEDGAPRASRADGREASESPGPAGRLFEMDIEPDQDQGSSPIFHEPTTPAPVVAGLGPRLLAGAADLLIHGGVLAGVALGLYSMAVDPRVPQWPAFLVLLLSFSFLYTVVSLAFWGQTAGMAWCETFARDRLGRPLSFRQAAVRWLGGLLTLGLIGLPLLSAARGKSLSDWLSRTITYWQPAAG